MNHIKPWLRSVLCGAWIALLYLTLSPVFAQTDPTERALEVLEGHRPDAAVMAMNETRLIASGRHFVELLSTQLVTVLDLETAEVIQQIEDRRVVVSPDGLLMATYGADGRLELRDIATGSVLHDLGNPGGSRPEPPVFSADSALLLAGWRGDRAVVIDVASGEIIEEYRNGSDRQTPVGLSADGRFAVLTDRGTFTIFDRETARIARQAETPSGWSTGQLDSRGHLLVISEGQDYLSIVPLDRDLEARRVPLSRGGYSRIVLNDDRTLAAVRYDRDIAVIDLVAEALLFDAEPYASHRNTEVAFSPDSTLIAIGRSYGTVTFLDTRSGAFRGEYTPDQLGELNGLIFSENGTVMLSATDAALGQWPIAPAMETIAPTQPQMCFDVEISNSFDASIVVSGGEVIFSDQTRTLRAIAPVTGEVRAALDGFEQAVGEIGLSDDGRFLFAQLRNPIVEVRNVETGARVSLLGTHPARLSDVRLSDDGTRALTMDRDGVAALWDVTAGDELHVYTRPEFPVSAIAFSDDGQMAAFGINNITEYIATRDGAFVGGTSFSFDEPVSHLAFLKDGALLVISEGGIVAIVDPAANEVLSSFNIDMTSRTALVEISPTEGQFTHRDGADMVVRDLRTGAELQRLSHGTVVAASRYSADGGRLLTSGGDGTTRLWDVRTGVELARYVGQRGRVTSVAFLPNDAGVVSAANDDQLCFFGRLED